jgi:hypothetical protein
VVFSRSADLKTQTVHLYYAAPHAETYPAGERLPLEVNSQDSDTYAPMLDWSHPSRLTFSGQRREARVGGVDLYLIEYRLVRALTEMDLKNGYERAHPNLTILSSFFASVATLREFLPDIIQRETSGRT